MRGENCSIRKFFHAGCGSSPHARGKHSQHLPSPRYTGLIPACAGKTVPVACIACSMTAHPRMRGENDQTFAGVIVGVGSSPHARGKPRQPLSCTARLRLIPACAGKTVRGTSGIAGVWAHPRMRGENECIQPFFKRHRGSSPHARGKRVYPAIL